MDILIQNLGQAPLYVPVKTTVNGETHIDRTIIFQEGEITKVSPEVYEKFILSSAFFKSRIEQGTIRILNPGDAEDANAKTHQIRDAVYSKYVDMMKSIRSAGGISNKDLRPHLNADGTPTLELLHANFGRNIDPEVANQFRTRWIAETGEGMHGDTIRLPGGVKKDIAARDVTLETAPATEEDEAPEEGNEAENLAQEIRSMKMEDLKKKAKSLSIEFDEKTSQRKLAGLVIRKLSGEEGE